jgi:hypothetical protein
LRTLEQSVARLDALEVKRANRFDGGPPRPERDGEPWPERSRPARPRSRPRRPGGHPA